MKARPSSHTPHSSVINTAYSQSQDKERELLTALGSLSSLPRFHLHLLPTMSVNDPVAAAAASAGSSYPSQEVQMDLTKLNALSPEVISKQATVSALYFSLAS